MGKSGGIIYRSTPVWFWCTKANPKAVAEDFSGRVKVAKVNVDAFSTLADRYDVRALPTMILFNRGDVVGGIMGYVSKQTLNAAFDALTGQSEPVTD